ncbi:type II secretion system F family protein [Cellulomonas fimi]|uniref:Type II secretion system F domain protein n=1 Tax=Cellulomonas fimi (strain ATCC 484 / DSM 20113 / JCM 1341 / CCUG 24087 / LMG 16345 / NBRC 15513 / NCIMB 8980 / NCTC 7547 / NRS-133) TaxID=590998 RepID=F4H616_CELFA|nr:type II secretion system F family protein [Cellulomonas fimi]AEE46746.1 Type II secretion system F domain protein [Cellulomonas fimi ATCC 484]NNH07609.1 type II secretion system protein F [Cellulomonas fimi]VEH34063.1 Flp pilus assembly protein TadB [Cellulomonas fimi]
MGVVVGLLLGAGLACIWWSCWAPSPGSGSKVDGWQARTQDHLVQAGMGGVTPAGLVLVSGGVGVLGLVLGLAVTRVPSMALCLGAFVAMAPSALVRSRARRRRARLRRLWPEVVDHLASGIRAGLALPEALAQIGERGPVELREPFVAFAEDYRATGRFGECLDLLKARLADPVADRIVEALRMTRDVGGTDLGRLLRTLSTFLREDLRTRGELEARQSWTVNAARLAAAAPWLVLGLLATRSEAAAAYDSTAGLLVLAAGAASTVVAYALMLRIARLPEDPRVLR